MGIAVKVERGRGVRIVKVLVSFLHTDIYKYAKDKVDYFFCLGEEWEDVKITNKTSFKIFSDHDDLYEGVKELIKQDTVTLVKGSRSTRMDIVADKLKN